MFSLQTAWRLWWIILEVAGGRVFSVGMLPRNSMSSAILRQNTWSHQSIPVPGPSATRSLKIDGPLKIMSQSFIKVNKLLSVQILKLNPRLVHLVEANGCVVSATTPAARAMFWNTWRVDTWKKENTFAPFVRKFSLVLILTTIICIMSTKIWVKNKLNHYTRPHLFCVIASMKINQSKILNFRFYWSSGWN